MKSKIIFTSILLLLSLYSPAQTAEEVYEHYLASVKNLKNLAYKMHKIDSFMSGEVWDKYGNCAMKRVKTDSLFGFYYKGKRDDIDDEEYYLGKEYLILHAESKLYEIQTEQIHRGLLGYAGGQMVLAEMVQKIENYNSLSLSQTDSSYILTFGFPDNQEFQITDRMMELHVFKSNFLPFYRYHTLYGFGDKQVNIAYLSKMKINNPEFEDVFEDKRFLDGYTLKPKKASTNKLLTLINNPAPDFELNDLQNNLFKLSDQSGKIVLIDFWELWCAPCIKSIPHLNEMASKYPKDKFQVWSIVSESNSFKKIDTMVETKGINYAVLLGNEEVKKKYFVYGVPLYLVVDQSGKIKHAQYGYTPEIDKVIAELVQ